MKRAALLAAGGALLLALTTISPVAAQGDAISVTPADGLLDGQAVEISATTTGSDYGTLALCPAASAPTAGTDVTTLLSTRDICVGLVCLHDGDTEPSLLEAVAADCPLAVQPAPISSLSTTVALPRVTNDGTDCAVAECVVVFNTWNSGSAQGAVAAAVTFAEADPADPTSTTTPVLTAETTSTTTTIELSAPSATSTVAPVLSSTTVATEVAGAQETNDDGELAVTGLDSGALAALGLALMAAGGGAVERARRASISRRSR